MRSRSPPVRSQTATKDAPSAIPSVGTATLVVALTDYAFPRLTWEKPQ